MNEKNIKKASQVMYFNSFMIIYERDPSSNLISVHRKMMKQQQKILKLHPEAFWSSWSQSFAVNFPTIPMDSKVYRENGRMKDNGETPSFLLSFF